MMSKRRAHSVGSAAAPAGVAPLIELEQRDLLHDVPRVCEARRGDDASKVVLEVVLRVEAAVYIHQEVQGFDL